MSVHPVFLPAKRCYIVFDLYTKLTSTAESSDTYVLRDDNIIIVGAERFRFAEVLFQIRFFASKNQRISQQFFPEPCLSGRFDTWLVRPANESDCTINGCGSQVKRVLTRRFFVLRRLSLCTLFCVHERATICTFMPPFARFVHPHEVT